ncbi:MAG TPA: penicillin-binding protein 2 [Proteobacteria bacterium]|mgnify:CR=1 FL=1|nr:penicillin-binding protein 2 [Pseudomonadota bacterium]
MSKVDNLRKSKREQILANGRLIMLAMAVVVIALVMRLWYLQIVMGDHFKQRSQDNRIRVRRIRALRGMIYDRNGKLLADNSLAFNLQMVPENIDQIEEVATILAAQIDNLEPDVIITAYRETSPATRHRPLTLKKNLSPDELARIEARKYELPGILIETEPMRVYPYDEICSHIIGYLGFINDHELRQPAYQSYARDDLVGRSGIEARYQDHLRGLDGIRQVEVNARGRELASHTDQPARSGGHLTLTIDIELQAYVFKLMGEEVGSLVALDPNNGEVLALVSTPAFSNNLFSTRISSENWREINENPFKPLQNRAVQGRYPPGSTFKPLLALLALNDQIVTPATKFHCSGSLTLGASNFRCWNRYGHGNVDLAGSLRESCDVYYYNLATRLAIDRIAAYSSAFGLGRCSGIELPEEKSGLLPTSSWKLKYIHDQWYTGDTLSVALGQGYLTATPLQIASLYAVFANGGTYYQPHLLKTEIKCEVSGPPDGNRQGRPIETGKAQMETVRQALWQVVNDKRGTAYQARIKNQPWEMAGKTGTAQVVKQHLDDLKNQKNTPRHLRDHAWFAAFAPYDKPTIAVAVIIEHGGHGSSVAAPIAREAIKFYLEN